MTASLTATSDAVTLTITAGEGHAWHVTLEVDGIGAPVLDVHTTADPAHSPAQVLAQVARTLSASPTLNAQQGAILDACAPELDAITAMFAPPARSIRLPDPI